MTAAVQVDAPVLLVRGQNTTASIVLEEHGGAVEVSTATATVYDDQGEVQAAYTVYNSRRPTVTVLAAVTTGQDYSESWRIVWDLDGVFVPVAAYVVRTGWTPNVTDADLYRRVRSLDPSGPAPTHSRQTFEPERQEATAHIRDRLIQHGRRPWLVFEPHTLREPLLLLTLALIFEGFGSRDPMHFEVADRYRRQFEDAWRSISFTYDADQDGEADSESRESATGPLWLMAT